MAYLDKTVKCRHCGKHHNLFYVESTKQTQLSYTCDVLKIPIVSIKFQAGLSIPVRRSRKLVRREQKDLIRSMQPSLF